MSNFFRRKWSDAEKWGMGILGTLLTAALIGAFGYSVSAMLFGTEMSPPTEGELLGGYPSGEFYVEEIQSFCSLMTSSESVEPGETYNIQWEGAEGGKYWFVNDNSRLQVDYAGSYEFVWDDKDTLKIFELKGELNSETCTAYTSIFEKTEQPRCLIVVDNDLVEPGGSFRVSWFGYPVSNTVFRVNGTIVDHRDASSYSFPEDRKRPIDFRITGKNAEGECEDLLSVWSN